MGKWTPGPWWALTDIPQDCVVYAGKRKFIANIESPKEDAVRTDYPETTVAFDIGVDSKARQREAVANAHLIAAAPDLYEALRGLVVVCEELDAAIIPEDLRDTYVDALNTAGAALAKAEGKEAPDGK